MLAADMWSLACVMGEILRDDGVPLFRGKSSKDQATLIGIALGPMDIESTEYYNLYARNTQVYNAMVDRSSSSLPWDGSLGVPEPAIDLLKKLLTYDPRKRLTAKEVLRHPFFRGLNEEEHSSAFQAETSVAPSLYLSSRASIATHQARQNIKTAIHECNNHLNQLVMA
jgi:serine/threonine protein kinase